MNLETLHHFCTLCATPGDETAVFDALRTRWTTQGLDIKTFGSYAITAQSGERKKSDTLLLIAHADAPGFIVSSVISPTECEVLVLGGILPEADAQLLLKTASGLVSAAHLYAPDPDNGWSRSQPLRVTFDSAVPTLQKGDRLCWSPVWEQSDDCITSPFLDNRIGCALLADWYDNHATELADYNVILAATAMEEVNGFGASVLARQVSADAVIALDVTYENEKQSVALGKGPVITLSDASVLLSMKLRDQLLACGVPLQTEVYNFSGTDAKAFPHQGCPTPVIPLLLATQGNHSPRETISIADLHEWPSAIHAIARTLFEKTLHS
ncbi:MAG: hypothetical protein RSD41_06815 [Kiritimatiellia bacterium]